MLSSNDGRPERMYRNNRHIDPSFDENENLYNRFKQNYFKDGKFLPEGIRFPDWSVNREKYSEPEDVLIPNYSDWGIIEFKVGAIPQSLESLGDVKFDFKVEHDPYDDNYSHSEVRTYKNGVHEKRIDLPKLVKKEFRQRLSEKIIVIKQPTTLEQGHLIDNKNDLLGEKAAQERSIDK